MLEKHPYGDFVPPNPKFVFLGSFPARRSPENNWFFSNSRNQLWPILTEVYKTDLDTKEKKQALFKRLGMAIADIIISCERKKESNMDIYLTNITINSKGIREIFNENKIEKIYFSGRFVEKLFRKHFPDITQEYPADKLVTLPSPSPRYNIMTKAEKVKKYAGLLPR